MHNLIWRINFVISVPSLDSIQPLQLRRNYKFIIYETSLDSNKQNLQFHYFWAT